jgi:hypothetical protein
MRTFIITLVLASPAWAETPIDGDAFEALVTGKTLTYSNATGPYGIEYYAPNRQVIWSFIGGECEVGKWSEVPTEIGPSICFTYESEPDPQCWYVYDNDGQIRADFVGRVGGSILYQLAETEPLVCGGVGA